MKTVQVTGLVVLVALLVAGCATQREEEIHLTQIRGMYSALDATALVYSNPMAQAPVEDHPWRWLGFFLHPVGVAFDYAVNRPLYALSSLAPDVFGYTSEDVLIESQRRR